MGINLKGLAAAGGVAIWLGAAPAPAAAAIVDYVFEGVLTGGEDVVGVFGDAGPFAGRAIVIRTSFDTSVNRISLPFYADGAGGIAPDPALLSATLTVGGATYAFPTATAGFTANTTLYQSIYDAGVNTLDQGLWLPSLGVDGAPALFLKIGLDAALPDSLDTPFDVSAPAPGGEFGGMFFLRRYDAVYGLDLGEAQGEFHFTRAYVDTSAAPEPAGWALLILGFGAAGATLRRRTRLA